MLIFDIVLYTLHQSTNLAFVELLRSDCKTDKAYTQSQSTSTCSIITAIKQKLDTITHGQCFAAI